MRNDMKCPICGTPLEYDMGYDGDYSCAKCGRAKMFGSEELWQALTDSMKEYDLCHDALVERTKELIRTRKALDIIKKEMSNEYMPDFAVIRDALKSALEQKD